MLKLSVRECLKKHYVKTMVCRNPWESSFFLCVCVCGCVRVRVRACVRACVHVRVCVCWLDVELPIFYTETQTYTSCFKIARSYWTDLEGCDYIYHSY